MGTVFALVRESPTYLVAIACAAAALVLAFAASRLSKAWLFANARRHKSDLNDVMAASLPRPIAGAAFLVLVDATIHWFGLEEPSLATVHRWMRFAIGIFIVLTAARVGRKAIDAYGRSNPDLRSSAGLGKAIIWVIGLSATALLLSDALGISLAPALTALGVGSLAVALALQDTLSNFFSGIYLIVDKPVRQGEFIRLDSGQEGYVEAIGWRATVLRTLVPSLIVVPNATLAKGVTTNFRGHNPRLAIELRFDVAPECDVHAVEQALAGEAARMIDIDGVAPDPTPRVRFIPGASHRALGFTLYYRLKADADAFLVQSEIRKRVLARMRADKIPPAAPRGVFTSSSSAS